MLKPAKQGGFYMEHKHKIVRKSSGAQGSHGLFAALAVVLVLAAIAGVIVFSPIGKYLNDTVIGPLFSCSEEKKEDQKIVSALSAQDKQAAEVTPSPKPAEPVHSTVTVEETPFFILQMGTFTTREDAEKHAAEIRRMGAGGYVYPEGSVFRVFAAAYTDESSLIKVQSQVRADGFEATPYLTDKKAVKLTLEGDPKAVSAMKDLIELINSIPNRLCELCLLYDKGEINGQEAADTLQKILESCKSSRSALANTANDSVEPIRNLLSGYQEKISTFLQENDMIEKKTASGELKRLQLAIIADYILFFDRK